MEEENVHVPAMQLWSYSSGTAHLNETDFDSVARYSLTGMATMPKLMAPFHIDRCMDQSSHKCQGRARTGQFSDHVPLWE